MLPPNVLLIVVYCGYLQLHWQFWSMDPIVSSKNHLQIIKIFISRFRFEFKIEILKVTGGWMESIFSLQCSYWPFNLIVTRFLCRFFRRPFLVTTCHIAVGMVDWQSMSSIPHVVDAWQTLKIESLKKIIGQSYMYIFWIALFFLRSPISTGYLNGLSSKSHESLSCTQILHK